MLCSEQIASKKGIYLQRLSRAIRDPLSTFIGGSGGYPMSRVIFIEKVLPHDEMKWTILLCFF